MLRWTLLISCILGRFFKGRFIPPEQVFGALGRIHVFNCFSHQPHFGMNVSNIFLLNLRVFVAGALGIKSPQWGDKELPPGFEAHLRFSLPYLPLSFNLLLFKVIVYGFYLSSIVNQHFSPPFGKFFSKHRTSKSKFGKEQISKGKDLATRSGETQCGF